MVLTRRPRGSLEDLGSTKPAWPAFKLGRDGHVGWQAGTENKNAPDGGVMSDNEQRG
jgi:hypothetical protein